MFYTMLRVEYRSTGQSNASAWQRIEIVISCEMCKQAIFVRPNQMEDSLLDRVPWGYKYFHIFCHLFVYYCFHFRDLKVTKLWQWLWKTQKSLSWNHSWREAVSETFLKHFGLQWIVNRGPLSHWNILHLNVETTIYTFSYKYVQEIVLFAHPLLVAARSLELNWIELNRPFAGPGHVTYPPFNLRAGTLWVPEIKRAGNNK